MDLSRIVIDLVPENRKCLRCIILSLPCDDEVWRCKECQFVTPLPEVPQLQPNNELLVSGIPGFMYKCLGQDPGFEWPFELRFDMTWLDCIVSEEDSDKATGKPGTPSPFKDGAMSYFPNDGEIKTSLRWFTSHNLRFGGMQGLLLPRLCPLLHQQALRDLAAHHLVPCDTLEDWWKTFLMSGLIISTWKELVVCSDSHPFHMDYPVKEIIKLFRYKTLQLLANLDTVTPDTKALGSMRATHPLIEETLVKQSTDRYSQMLMEECMSGGVSIFQKFSVSWV